MAKLSDITAGGGGSGELVDDPTPQLGGDLDVQGYTITTSVSNGGITLMPNGSGALILDQVAFPSGIGAQGQALTADGSGNLQFLTQPYNVSFYKYQTLVNGEIVLIHVATEPFVFPADFAGSKGYARVAPTDGDAEFDVQKNGASIGTVTFNQGTNTPIWSLNTETTYAQGDRLTVVAPTVADSSLATVTLTFKGTRIIP